MDVPTEDIRTKRVYEDPAPEDGIRVLVDRVWPRGMSRERASVDLWLKEAGPSTELRRWFGHDPAKWGDFKRRYFAELETNPAMEELRQHAATGTLTLVYSARDQQHNQAVALREFLLAES